MKYHSDEFNRNGLSYYRAQQIKLKDTDVYWKRSPEDICHGSISRIKIGLKYFLILNR
jgi:hypothetical protein